MLIPLAVIIVVVVTVVLMRNQSGRGSRSGSFLDSTPGEMPAPSGLAVDLDRWVGAGLIERHQADAIARFEAEAAGPPRRISLATEAFGYVGAALATAGVIAAVVSMWDDLSAGVHLAIGAGAAVLMLAAGALVIRNTEPALRRLGTVLWFLAAGATAMTLSILTLDVMNLDDRISEQAIAVIVSGGTAVAAGVLWWLSRSGLQQLALFVAAIVTLTASVSLLPGEDEPWMIAVTVWLFGLVWTALGWRHLVTPMPIAVGLGAAAVLIGPSLGIPEPGWLFIPALGTAAAAMVVSIPARQVPLLAAGTTGLFIYLTWAVVHYFGDTLGVPLALSVCGLLFIGLAVVAGRLRRMTLPPGPGGGGGLLPTGP